MNKSWDIYREAEGNRKVGRSVIGGVLFLKTKKGREDEKT